MILNFLYRGCYDERIFMGSVVEWNGFPELSFQLQ